jgi:stress response protein YsnF
MEEVLVVEKRLMVREEIRLTSYESETRDKQTVPLRKEVVQIEHLKIASPDATPTAR